MRVLMLSRVTPAHGPGGMQDHALDLARGLSSRGHDVTVLATRHPDGVLEDIQRGARVLYQPDGPVGRYSDQWDRWSLRRFHELEHERAFDVVHSQSVAGRALLRRDGREAMPPLVITFHGGVWGAIRGTWRSHVSPKHPRSSLLALRAISGLLGEYVGERQFVTFRRHHFIVVSEEEAAESRRVYRLLPERLHVIPNGVDTDLYRPGLDVSELRARWRLPEEGPTLLVLGRLARDKGVPDAVRAFARIRLRHARAVLVIVGDGEALPEIEATIDELGVRDAVRLTGPMPVALTPLWYNAADLFLFTTLRQEAAPLVVPQAMACGLPVLASRLGGIPTAVVDGETGCLLPPARPDLVAEKALALLADETALRAMAAAARQRALDLFTLARMTERTERVYHLAVSGARAESRV